MTTTPGSHAYSDPDGSQDSSSGESRSVGEIVGDVVGDLTTLVRQEITLAKTEAKEEAVKAGKSAGMLGGAGVAGHLFLIFFSLFLTFLIAEWFDSLWAGALIVAVLWAIVAAVLAAMGRKKLKEVAPPMETTTQTLKEDAQWVKTRNES